ncbi:unnamed protein product, partial [Cyprideis torosa]
KYLQRYGYHNGPTLSAKSAALTDVEKWIEAIKDFQEFAGLNITGELTPILITNLSSRPQMARDLETEAIAGFLLCPVPKAKSPD